LASCNETAENATIVKEGDETRYYNSNSRTIGASGVFATLQKARFRIAAAGSLPVHDPQGT